MKDADMKKEKIVRYSFDLSDPPPLTELQKRELETLANMPDDAIDLSDMPELPDSFFENAIRNPFLRPVKKQLTLRLDADILDWFKRHADTGEGKTKGYQTRINRALREYVTGQQKKAG